MVAVQHHVQHATTHGCLLPSQNYEKVLFVCYSFTVCRHWFPLLFHYPIFLFCTSTNVMVCTFSKCNIWPQLTLRIHRLTDKELVRHLLSIFAKVYQIITYCVMLNLCVILSFSSDVAFSSIGMTSFAWSEYHQT